MLTDWVDAMLIDKGYDAYNIRAELAEADVETVAPTMENDRKKYRWRNLVERLFNEINNWRRRDTL